MTLTGSMLGQALAAVGQGTSGRIDSLDNLAALATAAMVEGNINTPDRCAGFLSQVLMESDYLRTTTEYGHGQRYAPWIGRTGIQITWEENYQGFGSWLFSKGLISNPNKFLNSPSSLGDVEWFWLGAVWYWTKNRTVDSVERRVWSPWANCNEVADTGDIVKISAAVNAGNPSYRASRLQGLPERKAMWNVLSALGSAIVPGGTTTVPTSPVKLAHFGNYRPGTFGWSVPSLDDIVPFKHNGISFPSGVHHLAADAFTGLLDELVDRNVLKQDLYTPGCWGYEYRPVTGGTSLSFHGYGLALDVNAPSNPYVRDGSAAAHAISSDAADVAKGRGFEWGGAWTRPKDYMHFELHLSPEDAKSGTPVTPPSKPIQPVKEENMPLNASDFAGIRKATMQEVTQVLRSPEFSGLLNRSDNVYLYVQDKGKVTHVAHLGADGRLGADLGADQWTVASRLSQLRPRRAQLVAVDLETYKLAQGSAY